MKIVVFGATGGTGKNVVERGLAAGHAMVAVARRPDAVAAHDGLTVHKGDVLDAASVATAVAGADAVVCCIGPKSNSSPGTLISDGTRNILAACESSGVKRFVFESGMITSDRSELSAIGGFATRVFGWVYPALKADKVIAEAAIQASSLDWVIVRPPALSHAPATGKYIAGPGARIFPGKKLSHADCAEVFLKAATESEWVKKVVNAGIA